MASGVTMPQPPYPQKYPAQSAHVHVAMVKVGSSRQRVASDDDGGDNGDGGGDTGAGSGGGDSGAAMIGDGDDGEGGGLHTGCPSVHATGHDWRRFRICAGVLIPKPPEPHW